MSDDRNVPDVLTAHDAMDWIKRAEDMDTESGHVIADDVLCAVLRGLGYSELVEAFNKLDKWYA